MSRLLLYSILSILFSTCFISNPAEADSLFQGAPRISDYTSFNPEPADLRTAYNDLLAENRKLKAILRTLSCKESTSVPTSDLAGYYLNFCAGTVRNSTCEPSPYLSSAGEYCAWTEEQLGIVPSSGKFTGSQPTGN